MQAGPDTHIKLKKISVFVILLMAAKVLLMFDDRKIKG
jgi:hypothetical protein